MTRPVTTVLPDGSLVRGSPDDPAEEITVIGTRDPPTTLDPGDLPNDTTPRIYYPRALVLIDAHIQDASGAVTGPHSWYATPLKVEISNNNDREANTCKVELEYVDFPLDPRLLSNVIVTVMMGDIGSLNARAYGGADYRSRLTKITHFRRFIGRLDEPEMAWDNAGRVVQLPCRDYTGIFLDTTWGQEEINTGPGVPLEAVVGQIFRSVIKPPSELPPPLFVDPSTAAIQVGAVTGKTLFVTENEDKAWDVLTRLLDLFGLVPTFELDQLTIRTPTTKGLPTARFVYGHNVERISLRRNMRRAAAKQVKVVAYDPASGKALSAVWPTDADPDFRLVSKTTGTKSLTTTIQQTQYNLPPATYTPEQLLAAAQTVYIEAAEQEIQGELTTRELVDSASLELMSLKNRDILVVTLAPAELGLIDGMSRDEAITALVDQDRADPMSPSVATVLVNNLDAVQSLAARFYITEATHTWDRDDGYQLAVKFRDFLLSESP